MGISLDEKIKKRLKEGLDTLDELYASMTDSEELDPRETFFEALQEKNTRLSKESTNDRKVLSQLRDIRTELLVTLSKAINELRNDLKNEFSALVERGKFGDSFSSESIEPMYKAAASSSASRENNYRDLGNSINAFGQYLREIEHRNEKIREENEYRNEKQEWKYKK